MADKYGFSLMEVLLAVIIVAILVSIAVPNFIQATERARAREAIATLEAMMAAQKTYASETRMYIPLDNGSNADSWSMIGMENPNQNDRRSFDYVLTVADGGTTFNALATRNGGSNAGEVIAFDENGGRAASYTWTP